MGNGYSCKCNKCDYGFMASLGVGLMFPEVYEDTVKAMKSGEYGDQPKSFFQAHPDGAIDCDNVVVRCRSCGKYATEPRLDMYVPKEGKGAGVAEATGNSEGAAGNTEPEASELRWSSACSGEDCDYVDPYDLTENYKLFEHYQHKCESCGGDAEIVEGFESKLDKGELKCPKCKDGVIELKGELLWD